MIRPPETGVNTTIPQGRTAGGTPVNEEDESDSPETQDGLLRIAAKGWRRIQLAAIKNRREEKTWSRLRRKSLRYDEETHRRSLGRAHRTLFVGQGRLRFPARWTARPRHWAMTRSDAAARLIA